MESIWRDELPQKLNPWSFLLFSSKPYIKPAIWSTFFVIIGAISSTGTAYVFKLIVDAAHTASTGGALTALWFSAGAYILISLIDISAWRQAGS